MDTITLPCRGELGAKESDAETSFARSRSLFAETELLFIGNLSSEVSLILHRAILDRATELTARNSSDRRVSLNGASLGESQHVLIERTESDLNCVSEWKIL